MLSGIRRHSSRNHKCLSDEFPALPLLNVFVDRPVASLQSIQHPCQTLHLPCLQAIIRIIYGQQQQPFQIVVPSHRSCLFKQRAREFVAICRRKSGDTGYVGLQFKGLCLNDGTKAIDCVTDVARVE